MNQFLKPAVQFSRNKIPVIIPESQHALSQCPFRRKLACFSAVSIRRNYALQLKPCLLLEVVPFNGSLFFYWKPFISVETIIRRHSLQWRLFLFVEAIRFNGNHSFQQKPFLLKGLIPFSGSHSFQQKPCISLSESHSFCWQPFL